MSGVIASWFAELGAAVFAARATVLAAALLAGRSGGGRRARHGRNVAGPVTDSSRDEQETFRAGDAGTTARPLVGSCRVHLAGGF